MWITFTNRINSTKCHLTANAQLFFFFFAFELQTFGDHIKGNEHPEFEASEAETLSHINPWDYLGFFSSIH